jgi:hypothetical protein
MREACSLEVVGELGQIAVFEEGPFEGEFAPGTHVRIVRPAVRVESDHILGMGRVVSLADVVLELSDLGSAGGSK